MQDIGVKYYDESYDTGIFTMKQKLPGSQKKRKLPLIKLLIVYFELNWQAYAATIGASQPSVFNFFRYAFILRSLLN